MVEVGPVACVAGPWPIGWMLHQVGHEPPPRPPHRGGVRLGAGSASPLWESWGEFGVAGLQLVGRVLFSLAYRHWRKRSLAARIDLRSRVFRTK